MASEKIVLIGICVLIALLPPTLAQGKDCNLDDLFISKTLVNLIGNTIKTGDNTNEPSIKVHRNHTVCLAVGRFIRKVSSISLVIEYTCTGSANCPGGAESSEKYIEQFDFGCQGNSWSVGQFSDFGTSREKNSLANFETTNHKNCAACFKRHPSISGNYVPFDPVTHCVSKSVNG